MQTNLYTIANVGIGSLENNVAKLESQISTGKSVSVPSDNPGAYATAAQEQESITEMAGNTAVGVTLQARMGAANSALQQVSGVLNSAQAIVLQGINGTSNASDRNSLASQVGSAISSLIGLGNTAGPNGGYIFGGTRNTIAPFQTNGSGSVVYMGDSGSSTAAISPNVTSDSIVNGEPFISALSGNGIVSLSASSSNTGAAILTSSGIVNPTQAETFQTGSSPITLSFLANPSGSGQIYTFSQGGSTIGTGNFTPGQTLQAAGVSLQIKGPPANGDTFTLSPSRPQSIFDALQQVQAALGSPQNNPAQIAQVGQILDNNLGTLNQYQQTITGTQAQMGVTLQAVANASTANAVNTNSQQTNIANLTATNIPQALTSLTEASTAMTAAMKAFQVGSQLSLFNFIQ